MPRISHLSSLRSPEGVERAKSLRSRMTEAEHRLWYRLRAGRFGGRKFRRQVPLGPFIVDFLCEPEALVVEIDGGQHDEARGADDSRTAWLNARGYRVIRFWNNEVLGNIDGVLDALARALA